MKITLIVLSILFSSPVKSQIDTLLNSKTNLKFYGCGYSDTLTYNFFKQSFYKLKIDNTKIIEIDIPHNLLFEISVDTSINYVNSNSKPRNIRFQSDFIRELIIESDKNKNLILLGKNFTPYNQDFLAIRLKYPNFIDLESIKIINNYYTYQNKLDSIIKNTFLREVNKLYENIEFTKISAWDKFYIKSLLSKIIFNDEKYIDKDWLKTISEKTKYKFDITDDVVTCITGNYKINPIHQNTNYYNIYQYTKKIVVFNEKGRKISMKKNKKHLLFDGFKNGSKNKDSIFLYDDCKRKFRKFYLTDKDFYGNW